jgi:hypothetical protein
MRYRGIMRNGVVVLEGEKPSEGTVVEVIPVRESASDVGNVAGHPVIGIWKDRTDLPDDPVEVSKALRQRLMRRADE